MDDKIKVLDGGGASNPLANTVRQMKKNLPFLMDYMEIVAQLSRKKYDELRKQDFTDEQAIELCKKIL